MVEPAAEDVLARNGHQGTWSVDVEWGFQGAAEQPSRGVAHRTPESQTTGHGRMARRRPTVTEAIAWLQGRKAWGGCTPS
jgi:hypothetical protein